MVSFRPGSFFPRIPIYLPVTRAPSDATVPRQRIKNKVKEANNEKKKIIIKIKAGINPSKNTFGRRRRRRRQRRDSGVAWRGGGVPSRRRIMGNYYGLGIPIMSSGGKKISHNALCEARIFIYIYIKVPVIIIIITIIL